jgi:transcriptional regulator with XRE-family HTH domain
VRKINIGEKIRKRREELGMSLTDLSEASELSQSYISMIENGTRQAVSVKTISKLARALRLKTNYLTDDLTAAVDQIIDLPEDIITWLNRQDTLPYVRLAVDLHGKKLPPEKAQKFIESLYEIMKDVEK